MRNALSVAIITNCRQPALLRTVVSQWLHWLVPVYVSTNQDGADALKQLRSPLLDIQVEDVSKESHGRTFGHLLSRAARLSKWVLRQDDDIVSENMDRSCLEGLTLKPNILTGVKLVGPQGDRWYDWARFSMNDGSTLLSYGEHHKDAYVTGGAQLISREAIPVVADAYADSSCHRTGSDAKACLAAARAGIRLVSQTARTPTFIHLDPRRMVNLPHNFNQKHPIKEA